VVTPETSLSERAYREVLDRLLHHRYPPGAWLSARELSQELGMSRTPINEALKRLAAEGFLEALPRAGYRVVRPGPEEVEAVFLTRAALEGVAAYLLAQKGRDLTPLEAAQRACEEAAHRGDAPAFAQANRRFHEALVGLAGNPYLEQALRRFWHASRYMFLALPHFREYMNRSVAEHRAILAALKAGLPETAKKAVEEHLHRCGLDLRLQAAEEGL